MGSYNKFRGQWASQNHYLLTHILRNEWGFKGLVMSDWDAVHSTTQALWNGMDLEMGTDLHMLPNPQYGKFFLGDTVVSIVKSKRFPEYLLDEKVRRILYVMAKTNMLGGRKEKRRIQFTTKSTGSSQSSGGRNCTSEKYQPVPSIKKGRLEKNCGHRL